MKTGPGSAIAIGNCDGVHLGHQALLRSTAAYARQHQLQARLLTFHPHPTVLTAPDRVPPLITSLDDRVQLAKQAGVDHVDVLAFTPAIAALPPRLFIQQILLDQLSAKAVFVGENFRFAARREGTPEVLAALGRDLGFYTDFLPPVIYRGQIVSSTAIRQYLTQGRIGQANRLLGRCFSLAGPVVSGHGIGSKQTVPTLNLRPAPDQLVPRGVFATETFEIGGPRRWRSITNAGTRPTFNGDELTVETFLLDPFEPPTPVSIRVEFHRFLRAERPFPDPAALRAQILRDVARTQRYWQRLDRLKTRVAPQIS